ncbi:hypothetical protein [Rhodococcus sp. NPDC060176]|uniref:hypothetical protein n=1 Tax=Rhodococcus sp. NPDC060176 TaxID=3347062 RepID=UPI0036480EED
MPGKPLLFVKKARKPAKMGFHGGVRTGRPARTYDELAAAFELLLVVALEDGEIVSCHGLSPLIEGAVVEILLRSGPRQSEAVANARSVFKMTYKHLS